MTTTNPDFPAGFVHAPFIALRGIRIYIHSTDLYDEILIGARAAGWPPVDGAIELRCRLPITTRPAFIEVFLDGDKLYYRPVDSKETEGVLLYEN